MSDKPRTAGPATIVIFGAAGDLTARKLLPALVNLVSFGLLDPGVAVVGVARRKLDDAAFREQAGRMVAEDRTGVTAEAWARFAPRLHFVGGDFSDDSMYEALAGRIAELGDRDPALHNVLFYLSTPPDQFVEIVRRLGKHGLNQGPAGTWRRLVVEKPFGRDLDSAVALNREIAAVFSEEATYRIDHYLGKETVQNLLVFRFGNGLFEPIWNRRYVDHVQITVAETLGVEGRGGYYDTAGVLRDMIQNHMFQLLALVAMEPPSRLQGEGVRNEKVKVLEAIRPMTPEEIIGNTARGQYDAGTLDGHPVPAYRGEERVHPGSRTETYAALKLQVDNWRWAGVPFYLRSGKRLQRRLTEIVIQFRRPPLMLFGHQAPDGAGEIGPNRLIVRIQPDEGITLSIQAKRPGPRLEAQPVRLRFSYADFGEQPETTGYEQLLYDALLGDATLFHRADMIEAAWRVATPILDVWTTLPPRDFPNYASGSWGPPAADALMTRDKRRWHLPE